MEAEGWLIVSVEVINVKSVSLSVLQPVCVIMSVCRAPRRHPADIHIWHIIKSQEKWDGKIIRVTRGTHWTQLECDFPVGSLYPSVFHNYTTSECEVLKPF